MSATEHEQPRRMGRPPKPAEDRKSATMRFRTREGLREQLEAAAEASGRSPSEEAEVRLQNSFKPDPLQRLAFGDGEDAKKFIIKLISAIQIIQGYENPKGCQLGSMDWSSTDYKSHFTRAAIRAAFRVLVNDALPAPASAEEAGLSPEDAKIYTDTINHMHDFGTEYAMLITGQLPRLAAALNADGLPEH